MRLIRGSGLTGLSGIPPVTKDLARPFIRNSREQVREYLRSKKIEWREDSSNKSKKFFRNKIRLDLMPLLKNYNPNIVDALSNYAELSRLDQNFINSVAEEQFKKIFKSYDFGLVGDISSYKLIDKSMRYSLIRMGIKQLAGDLKSLTLKHISKIDDSINSHSTSLRIDLPGNLVVSKGYQIFCISLQNELNRKFSYSLKSTGNWDLSPGLEVDIEVSSDKSLLKKSNIGCFSLKRVSFPIEVSNLEPGEKFIPYGMKNFKKVKNLLIDKKIPRFLRKKIPVFKCKGEIIWIGGLRVDDRFKVETKDENYLKIELVRPNLTDFFQGV